MSCCTIIIIVSLIMFLIGYGIYIIIRDTGRATKKAVKKVANDIEAYWQRVDYESLTPHQRQDYDKYANRHPEWSHEKIMKRIGVASKIDRTLDQNP